MTTPSSSSLADHSQWHVIAGRLVATAHLADVQLEHNHYVPMELAGVVFEAAGVTLASYEAFVTTIGRSQNGRLPDDIINTLRAAVGGLRTARGAFADLAPTLDGYDRGPRGR